MLAIISNSFSNWPHLFPNYKKYRRDVGVAHQRMGNRYWVYQRRNFKGLFVGVLVTCVGLFMPLHFYDAGLLVTAVLTAMLFHCLGSMVSLHGALMT